MTERLIAIADEWAADRQARQRRRNLERADFDRLADAGFLAYGVPVSEGGAFESVPGTTRTLCGALRIIARGDPSVALVASMHPAVVYSAGWLVLPDAPPDVDAAWQAQRGDVFRSVLAGHWWGTITSEPSSGGDMRKTRTVARPDSAGRYLLSGDKHFGSGTGFAAFMITTAVPAGEVAPDWFYLDMRDVTLHGDGAVRMLAEWDGHGMIATQSHSLRFHDAPAVRIARPGLLSGLLDGSIAMPWGFTNCMFAAVMAGIVDAAVAAARRSLAARRDGLGTFERMEFARAVQEAWIVDQVLEGMIASTEQRGGTDTIRGKVAIAELAESLTTRLCRVMGGGSFGRHSPFGFWFQDVRALGFLRPPWPLAHAEMEQLGWS